MTTEKEEEEQKQKGMTELRLQVPDDLYRAYQRCSWIIIHETGRSQLEIMEEMVHDFLVKHQC